MVKRSSTSGVLIVGGELRGRMRERVVLMRMCGRCKGVSGVEARIGPYWKVGREGAGWATTKRQRCRHGSGWLLHVDRSQTRQQAGGWGQGMEACEEMARWRASKVSVGLMKDCWVIVLLEHQRKYGG